LDGIIVGNRDGVFVGNLLGFLDEYFDDIILMLVSTFQQLKYGI